jgi:zinc transport system substrate-binding protein
MKHLLASIFALLIALPAQAASAPPKVLASIKPIHSIVAAVMGDTGKPELLIGGGASPHSYALKPSDARKIASADAIFWVGPVLETFLQRPFATLAPKARVVALSEAQGVLRVPARRGGLWQAQGDHPDKLGGIDGHLWLDPRNAAAMAHAVAHVLGAIDRQRAATYLANADAFEARMQHLDIQLARELAPVRPKAYIVFHDAFHYFELRYSLSPAGAVTVAADRPVGARRIGDLRRAIKQAQAICVFSTPQYPPKLVASLTEATDARVGVLDDIGADIPAGPALYETLMRRIAGSLVACLAPLGPAKIP